MPSFEVLLPLGALGLYLFDALLLLYSNELLFLWRRRRWRFAQSSSWLISGRRLYLPNPLTPFVGQFRIRWLESDTREDFERPEQLQEFLRALRPLRLLVTVLLGLLLALPLVIYEFGTGGELLVLMGGYYLIVVAMLSVVFARRRVLQLTSRSFVALAFDALACGPFAVNLVRKLCMRRGLAGNPIEFARSSFDPPVLAKLIEAICARVADEQQREPGPTARWAELERYRAELAAMRRAED